MTKRQILDIFEQTGAILKGHFKLSSGLHSGRYLQCARVLQYPQHAEKLCITLADKFKKDKPDAVVAPALGGIIVSYEVGRALGAKSLFMERVDSKRTLRRGFELKPGEKILVVEDVVTTGLSTREVIEVVKSAGAKVVGVGSLVDRSGKKLDFGVRFETLVKFDIPVFESTACPMCENGMPITKPGSRQ